MFGFDKKRYQPSKPLFTGWTAIDVNNFFIEAMENSEVNAHRAAVEFLQAEPEAVRVCVWVKGKLERTLTVKDVARKNYNTGCPHCGLEYCQCHVSALSVSERDCPYCGMFVIMMIVRQKRHGPRKWAQFGRAINTLEVALKNARTQTNRELVVVIPSYDMPKGDRISLGDWWPSRYFDCNTGLLINGSPVYQR